MSKLDELIAELCPDGVEFRRLAEITTKIVDGMHSLPKGLLNQGPYPVISAQNISNNFIEMTSNKYADEEIFARENKRTSVQSGDVLLTIVGAIGRTAVVADEKMLFQRSVCVITPNYKVIESWYLKYVMDSSAIQEWMSVNAHGAAQKGLYLKQVESLKIPVPPLEVQREIVRVLDNFTFLSAELSAELSARRKQYEYYRNQLLTFDNNTKKMPLSDVANLFRGEYITQNGSKQGNIPVILGGQEPAYYIDKANHEGEIVVIARSGVSAGFVSYWNQPIYVTDGFGYEARKGVVIPKYLYYTLKRKEPELNAKKRGAGVPHVSGKMLGKVELFIPPIEVQERLVYVLDNFESICSDLNIGLPAEIEARKKQYEYYRDLLLTFAETGGTLVTDRQTDRQAEITLLQYVFGYVLLPLGDTCDMKAGKAIKAVELADEEDTDHPYMCYGGNGLRGFIGKSNYSGEHPIIGRQGALCGNVQYAEGEFYATEHAVVVTSKGLYRQRYLYYLVTVMNLNQYKSAGAQPGLAVGKLETIFAPVPSLEQQDNTVKILDQFNRLCNDLYIGLPAEIEARQKQYEYYRDKLLTFREKA